MYALLYNLLTCIFSMFRHLFMRLSFVYIFFLLHVFIPSVIKLSCQLFVRVSDQQVIKFLLILLIMQDNKNI